MTRLRFVGDLPIWLGIILAFIAAIGVWFYYRREIHRLSKTYRWLLPLLRGAAFILAILILTGPVLQHRKVEGEIGQVKIYVDASSSMELQDRAMSTSRKLAIATSLGWIVGDDIDTTALQAAESLERLRLDFLKQVENEETLTATAGLRDKLQTNLSQFPPSTQQSIQQTLLPMLEVNQNESNATTSTSIDRINDQLKLVIDQLNQTAEEQIETQINAGNESLRSALSRFDESARWERAEAALLGENVGLLEKLREFHDIEVFGLSGKKAIPLVSTFDFADRGQNAFPSDLEWSASTDLVTGISSTQSTNGPISTSPSRDSAANNAATNGRSVAILITDGQHNSGPSPIEFARQLANQKTPVFTIATGALKTANDLAVTEIDYPDRAFRKDRVRGTLVIQDNAIPGQPLLAQIKSQDRIVWQESLQTQGTGERRIEFNFPLDEEMDRLYQANSSQVEQHVMPLNLVASVAPLVNELETANNQKEMRIGVVAQVYRVLLLDGRSRWETRYLRNAFERDQRWQVTTVIAGSGTSQKTLPRGEQVDQFPMTREALFDYDLLVLGEIDFDLFAAHELDWLEEFVSIRGGGCIMIDGQRSKLRDLTTSSLASLLPVAWQGEAISSETMKLDLTTTGQNEPAFRLQANAADNRRFWNQIPAPHNIQNIEALPGTTVLVDAEFDRRRLPAIVTRQVGAGKTLYLSFDETWRWRFKSAEVWHQRIWNQLAIYLLPPPFTVSDDYLSLETGGLNYRTDETVPIRLRLSQPDGQPNSTALVDALIWKGEQLIATVSMTPDANVPGMYRGQSREFEPGDYRVTVRASGYADQALKASTEFTVTADDSVELLETQANQALLSQIARESGGQFLLEEQLPELPKLLSAFSAGHVVESETQIWQGYGWFGAVLLLLGMEWFLRKRAGLL